MRATIFALFLVACGIPEASEGYNAARVRGLEIDPETPWEMGYSDGLECLAMDPPALEEWADEYQEGAIAGYEDACCAGFPQEPCKFALVKPGGPTL